MPIPVRCACGKALNAPDALAGKKAKCPGCGAVLSIPAPAGAAAKPAVPLPAAPKPAPAAAKPVPAKAAARPTPLSQAKTEVRPAAKGSGTFQAPESEDKDLHAYSACPSCNSFVSKKDAICVQCGTHLVTGKQLTTVVSSEPTGPAKSVAVLCLLLNLILPGIGTLIGGGRSARMAGILQLALALVSVALLAAGAQEPLKAWLTVVPGGGMLPAAAVFAGGAIWGLLAGLKILKNAKPAA